MIKQIFFYQFFLYLVWAHVVAEEPLQPEQCWGITDPFRLGIRHVAPKGVGYDHGYTTLETFFAATEAWGAPWIPFLDLRGHWGNHRVIGANAGAGLRYQNHRIWGVSGYYDYRRTHSMPYHQVSFGLESLGTIWDFRINGYLPVRKTKQKIKREYALKSANMEGGLHLDRWKKVSLYCAGGPYYLAGSKTRSWGGEVRAKIELIRHISLQVKTSYDSLFKWIAQGEVGFFISWGGRKEIVLSADDSCHEQKVLRDRSLRPVDRNEIIPVHKSY